MTYAERVKQLQAENRYRVQSILHDRTGRDEIESVADSFATNDYKAVLDIVMHKHRFSSSYEYIVLEIATQTVIVRTTENKYSI